MSATGRAVGPTMTAVGCLCIVGTAVVIRELVTLLPELPEQWWHPAEALSQRPGEFDLRAMVVDLSGIARLGSWLYAISFLWLGVVAWRRFRKGMTLGPRDRVLVAIQAVLVIIVLALTQLTPLKYPWFHRTPL